MRFFGEVRRFVVLSVVVLGVAVVVGGPGVGAARGAAFVTVPGTGRPYAQVQPADSNDGVVVAGDGSVWFSDGGRDRLGHLVGSVLSWTALGPGAVPGALALGADGSVWVAERSAVGRVTPSGVVTRIPVAGGDATSPFGIVVGPDAAVWFTMAKAAMIGRLDPGTGTVTSFANGGTSAGRGITVGPDANLWYALPPSKAGRMTPTGTPTLFGPKDFSANGGITSTGGLLWFNPIHETLGRQLKVRGLTPGGAAGPTRGDLTADPSSGANPIASLRDGRLAVAEAENPAVYDDQEPIGPFIALAPTSGKTLELGAEHGVPGEPVNVAGSPDGTVWLTTRNGTLLHLLLAARDPCAVPRVIGYPVGDARLALRIGDGVGVKGVNRTCPVRTKLRGGGKGTPVVVAQSPAVRFSRGADAVVAAGSQVNLTLRRRVAFRCFEPSVVGYYTPAMRVLREPCTLARALYRRLGANDRSNQYEPPRRFHGLRCHSSDGLTSICRGKVKRKRASIIVSVPATPGT